MKRNNKTAEAKNRTIIEVKAGCPCPLAINFIKNVLKKNKVEINLSYYSPEGFLILEIEGDKNKAIKIMTDAGFIANFKEV